MKKLILIALALLIHGCSPVTVQHQGQIPTEFAEIKATYGWLPNSVPGGDIRVNNPEVEKMVHNSVEKQLLSMGYIRVEPEKADYLINWFGTIEDEVKEISLASFYRTYGYNSLRGNMPKNVESGKVKKIFSRGTLILDVLDHESKNVLWRGSATNTILDGMSKNKKQEYIDLSVKKILKKLPGK